MPEKTLLATETSGQVDGDQVRPNYEHAHSVFAALEEIGVNMTQVTDTLEREGVEKFVVSWQELLTTVQSAMEATE
jgi:transaldolase